MTVPFVTVRAPCARVQGERAPDGSFWVPGVGSDRAGLGLEITLNGPVLWALRRNRTGVPAGFRIGQF